MKTIERINVRRAINALQVKGVPLKLPKESYIPSSVRSTAASVKADTGKSFKVSVGENYIIVSRFS